MIIILTTFATKEDATRVGKLLLQERLIACYNFLPVESAYWWKEKIEEANEILMLMKTRDEHFDKVSEFIKKHAGYEIPEIIAVSPEKVNETYLRWVTKEITSHL